jgi:DNA-binding PadR family transcriptional regulator
VALGDAILACLTERPMTGYELAKTFDASLGFFWKADHQQIYRELSRLRDRGHIQGREVVQSGKPNKLVYTLTPEGRAALRHWAARPSVPPPIKDDLLVRLYALDGVDIEPLRADLMARLEHHRDRFNRYDRILKKRFPDGCSVFASACVSNAAWRSGVRRRSMPSPPSPTRATSCPSTTTSARADLAHLPLARFETSVRTFAGSLR